MVLPNFICVGAQKAGSSTLYKLLKSHPEVHMSEQKEIHFFDNEKHYNKGKAHYASFFSEGYAGEKVIGEISPDYMQFAQVPKRIKSCLGPIKIVIILRHPVDRSYSQFNFHKMLKLESSSTSFEASLETEEARPLIESRTNWYTPTFYKSKSLYSAQVQQFIEEFGRENVHVVVFEEMLEGDLPNLAETCNFLNIDAQVTFKKDHSNPTILNMHSKSVIFLRKFKDVIKPVLPSSLIMRLNKKVKNSIYKSPVKLTKSQKKSLFELHFREDVNRLESILGRSFSIWYEN